MYYKNLIATINKTLESKKENKNYDNLVLFKRIILSCHHEDINDFMGFIYDEFEKKGFEEANILKYIRQCGILEKNDLKIDNYIAESDLMANKNTIESLLIKTNKILLNTIKETIFYQFLSGKECLSIFINAIYMNKDSK